MRLSRIWIPFSALAAIALSRILFRSHLLYDVDSVNFALGMGRFDPSVHQPHPPGYFLYIWLARFAGMLTSDRNTALVAISIAASCAAAWMIHELTREWFGPGAARASLLLFLISPLGWFHGTVALTYMPEAFFSASIGLFCWRVYTGRANWALPAAALFALAAGFRPSIALLLGPLFLFSIWRAGPSRRWLAFVTGLAVGLCWFVPMVESSGGFSRYFEALSQLWFTVPGKQSTWASPWLGFARILTIAWILTLCFGVAGALVLVAQIRPDPLVAARRRFTWLWLTPGLLFFTMVFLLFVNAGYLLVLTPPLFAVLATRAHQFLTSPNRRGLRWAAAVCGIGINCLIFLRAPLYCTYRSVHELERDLASGRHALETAVNPATTLIVGFDSHFLGFRHAGYYLPQFVTLQYPEIGYQDGKRAFVMKDRDTRALARIPTGGLRNLVFFPLPPGEPYDAYLKGVLSKLPPGTVRTVTSEGRELVIAPIADLPFLFPATARGPLEPTPAGNWRPN